MFSFLLWEKASVVLNFFFPLTRSSFSSSFFMALFCFSVCSLSFVISWKLVKFPIMIHVLAKLQFRVIHIILLKFIYSFIGHFRSFAPYFCFSGVCLPWWWPCFVLFETVTSIKVSYQVSINFDVCPNGLNARQSEIFTHWIPHANLMKVFDVCQVT